jgi:predicted ArsR family transcriptional regulator
MESEKYEPLVIRRELQYLREKGLVNIEQSGKRGRCRCALRKGGDSAAGAFEEMGMASAASYLYLVLLSD